MGLHRPGNLLFGMAFILATVFIGKMLFTSAPFISKLPGAQVFGRGL